MKLKGTYNSESTYSVGDAVKFTDGHVYHLQNPTPAGIPPTNTLFWGRLSQTLEECALMILDIDAANEASGTQHKLANNLTTTVAGKGLDARQGKALKGLIDALNPDAKTLVLASSTASSTKKFAITIDDDGELTGTEITEESDT